MTEESSRNDTAPESEILSGLPVFARRGTIWMVVGGLLAMAALLYFGKVHVVVSAAGKLLPEGDVVIVQAQRAGIVRDVMAHAGDRLEAGTVIARLDISESGATLTELTGRYQLQEGTLAPIQSTLGMVERVLAKPESFFGGGQPILPAAGNTMQLILAVGDAKAKLDAAQDAVKNFPEQKKDVENEIAAARETFKVYEDNYKARVALYNANVKGLDAKHAQLEKFRNLYARGLMSAVELQGEEERMIQTETQMLEEKQRMQQLNQDMANQRAQLKNTEGKLASEPGTRAYAVVAAKALLAQAQVNLRQERDHLQLQAKDLQTSMLALKERIHIVAQQEALTNIVMPVMGVIAEIKFTGRGEVVAAGAPVALVLPEGVPLMVEATVANKDSGFVHAGLEARVKVDAYPFQHYGTVPAHVTAVLPVIGGGDTFAVRLKLDETSLHPLNDEEARLFPGLTVRAELMTARLRLADLLFSAASSRQ